MTTTSPSGTPFGGFDVGGPSGTRADASTDASSSGAGQPVAPAPTWRDLPTEPPYGPVPPPRTPNIRTGFTAPDVQPTSTFSARQIALAVGGTLLLVAIGITAALLVLDGDDEVAAGSTPEATAAPDDEDGPADVPMPTATPEPPRGELQPQQPPAAPPPEDAVPPPGSPLEPQPGPQPGPQPDTAPPQDAPPDPGVPAPQSTDEGVDLPRLFVLRTLPSGMEETSTTVRHTTRDDDVVLEQVTLLDLVGDTGPTGEVSVRATRSDDAAARLAGLIEEEGVEELSVRGLPAYLVAEGRLVWLVPAGGPDDAETLIEVLAPAEVRTDQLLTVANGLEMVR